ncbi:MAG: BatD family protein [Candidatus Omnitrophica bacterium]|nr:BatD family protein [Candidatus Omnitrophota bacterium]
MKIGRLILVPVFILSAVAGGPGKKVEVRVSIDKNQVKVGETFKYQIELKGRFRMSPEIIFPQLDGFRVLSQQRVFNIQMGRKGVISDSKNIFILLPLKEGEFEIKDVKIRLGWKEYKAPVVKITVKGGKTVPHTPEPEQKPQRVPSSGGGVWI